MRANLAADALGIIAKLGDELGVNSSARRRDVVALLRELALQKAENAALRAQLAELVATNAKLVESLPAELVTPEEPVAPPPPPAELVAPELPATAAVADVDDVDDKWVASLEPSAGSMSTSPPQRPGKRPR